MVSESRGLSVENLTVIYEPGAAPAVDAVSLDVVPGQIVALLGASGSGKSSLLRAVAGLVRPSSGAVRWDGADVGGVPVHRRGFGLMFQDGQLFPHRSVAGNIGYALNHLPRARRRARVAELLELVGLEGYGERAVSQISGGQAQRVALARSLAAEPRLLLLDEPLSSLDKALRSRLASDIRAMVTATGTTTVHVTHDQDEAFAVADLVGVMEDGRLVQLDAPAALWSHPADAGVVELLGQGPVLGSEQMEAWFGVTASGEAALAPGSLVAEGPASGSTGLEAEVVASRFARGSTELEVRLPDGRTAEAGADMEHRPGDRVRVSVRPDALVRLGTPSSHHGQ
ncbi:ABC transporter ATP-binding protein [Acidipropionibacterium acidipropionici]|jgi:thiamine transport system ATP-binding protein|uniref:ABC-type quaternary amine transporter n=1 Tax=Acidipropionibacterium acidipropionici TaxID=1748 RepID=A0AAC9FC82_9ACTN|nr:ABC transporter ATP-binding protein [Acidipropionibacterium acidipropionici]AMS05274.1 ABC transporter ATP-binding protein [Acidipropionibacterium acidipropionici]AOZ46753.1 ABC transporter ATP-binding protein [Acidipropionibacterium acidipropionici]AZP37177.1 ABC transporter ATP-binding protein [Acidipropionibacterium acidipropionici]